jgi:hypothetical protein
MCVISLCTRGALDTWSRRRSTAALAAMGKVTVNFVAQSKDKSRWLMVLVEQGPWRADEVEVQLRRVQDRLYNCIEAAIDGKLAEQFPASHGEPVTIQVDFYDVPEQPVRAFFERFSERALQQPSYGQALEASEFVESITFEADYRKLTASG